MKRNHVIIICIITIIATLAITASAIYMNEANNNNVQNITQNTTKPIQNNTTNITNNTTTIKENQNTNQEIQKGDSADRDGTLKAQTAREEANQLSAKQGVNEETAQKRADAWEQQAKTGKIYNGR